MKHIFTFLFCNLVALTTVGWGGRGHHSLCEAATFLVKNKNLREALTQKPHMMGHLCNIPDFHWKSLGPEVGKQGNSTHFIDPEILGIQVRDIPLDYKIVIQKYTGTKSAFKEGTVFSIPTEFGSNWWRADQFYRRSIELGKAWQTSKAPSHSKEEQDDSNPYNKAIYEFYVNAGIMGHFVGDNSQPFHCTADYDGWSAGHGGIHAFFEDSLVSAQPYNLTAKVVEAGLALQKSASAPNAKKNKEVSFLLESSVVEKMRSLGSLSLEDIPRIYKLDPIKKPSTLSTEKGMSLKTPAERGPAETVAKKFEPLIIRDMARGAVLLAQLWDQIYVEIGEPQLKSYKSYKFPFTPDFVPPDYFDLQELDKKGK